MLKLIHREGRKIIIAFLVFLVLLNFSIHYFFPEERLLHALLLIASLGGIPVSYTHLTLPTSDLV